MRLPLFWSRNEKDKRAYMRKLRGGRDILAWAHRSREDKLVYRTPSHDFPHGAIQVGNHIDSNPKTLEGFLILRDMKFLTPGWNTYDSHAWYFTPRAKRLMQYDNESAVKLLAGQQAR